MLGWPGGEFWWAHFNYRLCYGEEDYKKRCAWAEERHAEWVKKGYTFSFERNWQGRFHIQATPPKKMLA